MQDIPAALNRDSAISALKDLVCEGVTCPDEVEARLRLRNLGGLLSTEEIAALVIEAHAALSLIPPRPSRVWPRLIGIIAILMGIAAIYIEKDSQMSSPRRYSPAGYGLFAILLGITLILKPTWGKENAP